MAVSPAPPPPRFSSSLSTFCEKGCFLSLFLPGSIRGTWRVFDTSSFPRWVGAVQVERVEERKGLFNIYSPERGSPVCMSSKSLWSFPSPFFFQPDEWPGKWNQRQSQQSQQARRKRSGTGDRRKRNWVTRRRGLLEGEEAEVEQQQVFLFFFATSFTTTYCW